MKIGTANIVTADKAFTVGSKIIDPMFWSELEKAIANHTFSSLGQDCINLPDAIPYVSSGVARRSSVPVDAYHLRSYREGVKMFADRLYAAPVDNLSVVVYTQNAYAVDPDCTPEEIARLKDCDYVLIAVLASSGPRSPITPGRFCHNLAGGNNRYKPENGYTIEQAIAEAKEINDYSNEWVIVADREQKPTLDSYANSIGVLLKHLVHNYDNPTIKTALSCVDPDTLAEIIEVAEQTS